MTKKVILSLFDGMSCGQIALSEFLNSDEYIYLAAEIDPKAICITQKNFPQTIQLGDVTKIDYKKIKEEYGEIFMLLVGAPCNDLSRAGRQKGMVTTCEEKVTSVTQYKYLKKKGYNFQGESYLFWESIIALKALKPKYAFFENVQMKGEWLDIYNKNTGAIPYRFNLKDMLPVNRLRYYWTPGFPLVAHPQHTGLTVGDLVRGGVTGAGMRGKKIKDGSGYIQNLTFNPENILNCQTKTDRCRKVKLKSGKIRKLTVKECERMHGVPLDYTKHPTLSDSSRYNMLGLGWSVDMVKHFFKHLLEFNPKTNTK